MPPLQLAHERRLCGRKQQYAPRARRQRNDRILSLLCRLRITQPFSLSLLLARGIQRAPRQTRTAQPTLNGILASEASGGEVVHAEPLRVDAVDEGGKEGKVEGLRGKGSALDGRRRCESVCREGAAEVGDFLRSGLCGGAPGFFGAHFWGMGFELVALGLGCDAWGN